MPVSATARTPDQPLFVRPAFGTSSLAAWLGPHPPASMFVARCLKRRILEMYLNNVEFGPGMFGAEAAARHWFDRDAEALTSDQAARLPVILPDPVHRSLLPPDPWAAERATLIERRVGELGALLNRAR